jgi:hypothetical protein
MTRPQTLSLPPLEARLIRASYSTVIGVVLKEMLCSCCDDNERDEEACQYSISD